MTAELDDRHGIAPFVFTVSSIKWVLVIAGVVYAAIVLAAVPVRWRRLLAAD